ncbi:MAG: hypothetical protein ACYTBZ_24825, partial [Planctomycetota bacterium]
MSDQINTKRRKPFWVKVLYTAIPLCILLCIALIYDLTGQKKLEKALTEALKDGFPITLKELEATR